MRTPPMSSTSRVPNRSWSAGPSLLPATPVDRRDGLEERHRERVGPVAGVDDPVDAGGSEPVEQRPRQPRPNRGRCVSDTSAILTPESLRGLQDDAIVVAEDAAGDRADHRPDGQQAERERPREPGHRPAHRAASSAAAGSRPRRPRGPASGCARSPRAAGSAAGAGAGPAFGSVALDPPAFAAPAGPVSARRASTFSGSCSFASTEVTSAATSSSTRGDVEPQHQHDDAAERAVRVRVVGEVRDVEAEQARSRRPSRRRTRSRRPASSGTRPRRSARSGTAPRRRRRPGRGRSGTGSARWSPTRPGRSRAARSPARSRRCRRRASRTRRSRRCCRGASAARRRAFLATKPRVSSTSYALFIALISDEMPPVAAHSASSAPMLEQPGRVWPSTCSSCGWIWAATSGGRLSPMRRGSRSSGRRGPPPALTNAARAATKIANGNSANRNRYGEAGGELGRLVVHGLLGDALRELELTRDLHGRR